MYSWIIYLQQFFLVLLESRKKTHVTFSGILSFSLMGPFIKLSKSPPPPRGEDLDLKELKYLEYLFSAIPFDNSMAVKDAASDPESNRKL
jgi:hypothetical protein